MAGPCLRGAVWQLYIFYCDARKFGLILFSSLYGKRIHGTIFPLQGTEGKIPSQYLSLVNDTDSFLDVTMQNFCSSFHLLNLIHNHGLILFKSLKNSLTKKSLSSGWVVNLKDSYLSHTFSLEIFLWQGLSAEIWQQSCYHWNLKKWQKASKPKHIQNTGIQINIFKA